MHLSIAIGCCSWIFLLTFSRFCFQGSFFNISQTLKLCLNSVQVCVRLISLSMNRRDSYLLQFNSSDIRITLFNIVVVPLLNLKRHMSIGVKLNSLCFLYFFQISTFSLLHFQYLQNFLWKLVKDIKSNLQMLPQSEFSCLNSSIERWEQFVKFVNDVVLAPLLLTSDRFYTLYMCHGELRNRELKFQSLDSVVI